MTDETQRLFDGIGARTDFELARELEGQPSPDRLAAIQAEIEIRSKVRQQRLSYLRALACGVPLYTERVS
jgi:hypothetical protein